MVAIDIVQSNARKIMLHTVMESISWSYSVLATAFLCRAVIVISQRQRVWEDTVPLWALCIAFCDTEIFRIGFGFSRS